MTITITITQVTEAAENLAVLEQIEALLDETGCEFAWEESE